MKSIAFVDLEVVQETGKVKDYGCIKNDGTTFHSGSRSNFQQFLNGTEYLCGHNLLKHDIKFMSEIVMGMKLLQDQFIDTLFLSPLLFPRKPYHALLKDEKLQKDELNNPLSDATKAKCLLDDEIAAFLHLNSDMQKILYLLLRSKTQFSAFFKYIDYKFEGNPIELIRAVFANTICAKVDIKKLIIESPIELAYCLSNINVKDRFSVVPPWVWKSFPNTDNVMHILRNNPCLEGCAYCNQALDPVRGLKRFFGFDSYRLYGDKPLQENAVMEALRGKAILVIFPTGGGKSITFQVPALMSAETVKGLTVIISPLLSLMKDQVDNLDQAGITEAVTINGMLDPIERAKSIERIKDGSASILYISPESLRSRTIESLLLGRKIVRFVIDEAHCFSAWGHDFRVDYLYIGDFIKNIQQKKNLSETIPVSCFTATAKPDVVDDICNYFKNKLDLDLEVLQTNTARENLRYQVIKQNDDIGKYQTLRSLIEARTCPTIVYVSRTKRARELAENLSKDGFSAKCYHGQMDSRDKNANQNSFIAGETRIIVATSAFGMGVDKKDVGLVVHYEISGSLENYIQEAGRAGRDQSIVAECFILYCEDDLDKHFIMLNQTKINIKEIQQIWKAIKELTRYRNTISQSALEIAIKAGWDEAIADLETRVKTAICALEEAGYLERTQNMPRVYADSILCKNTIDARNVISKSEDFTENQKEKAIRIMSNLIANRSRSKGAGEEAEARVDYIAENLGMTKEEVIHILNVLRTTGLLADTKDLQVYISCDDKIKSSLNILNDYVKIERFLLDKINIEETKYNIKELNEKAGESGCTRVTTKRIMTVMRFWKIKHLADFVYLDSDRNHISTISKEPTDNIKAKIEIPQELARFIVERFFELAGQIEINKGKEEALVNFSVHDIKKAYDEQNILYKNNITIPDVEDALFYLSRIEAIKIEGGFIVIYNPMTITKVEEKSRSLYKKDDYKMLEQFYLGKMQQIHIVGEYARKMTEDYKSALAFVDDYFTMNYDTFLLKYFKADRREEITRNITPQKFRQLFGELSPTQLKIIKDKIHQYITVLAGPGSGKTRILVHKLASLIMMEDVRHEHLLMLTFTRAAATEFKQRLYKLIGNAAKFIEIKTFHSYCFDLLGRVGNIEKTEQIIAQTVEKIRSGDVEPGRIAKAVLVIDEAQDLDTGAYELINVLIEKNEEMRVIMVGDDDQNIFEFRGSDSKYMQKFIHEKQAEKYELITNYRSKNNLVEFTNQFALRMPNRLKQEPIKSYTLEDGRIDIVKYKGKNLIYPFGDAILKSELPGTYCVLTNTNDQALLVSSLLRDRGIPNKLIQSTDGFRLHDLAELRYFKTLISLQEGVTVVDKDVWETAKHELETKYHRSVWLENCLKIIKDFESVNRSQKYILDWEMFIKESNFEDFYSGSKGSVLVSTMHKAKGKEFDNVFVMLENFSPSSPEKIRQLYVAYTRAKNYLGIHLCTDFLDNISVTNLFRIENNLNFPPSNEAIIQTGMGDVFLDYFIQRQELVMRMQSGDALNYSNGECFDNNGKSILRFSKNFVERLKALEAKGFVIDTATVGFIVYWKKDTEVMKGNWESAGKGNGGNTGNGNGENAGKRAGENNVKISGENVRENAGMDYGKDTEKNERKSIGENVMENKWKDSKAVKNEKEYQVILPELRLRKM